MLMMIGSLNSLGLRASLVYGRALAAWNEDQSVF